jgi:lipopolysaccharide/colanic/teichoic acid biosynthesis glycosyltransferase
VTTWSDTHTPPTLKLQVALLLGVALTLVPAFYTTFARLLVILLAFAFALTSFPLLGFIARRDRAVTLIAPIMIVARAAALAAGLAIGILGEFARSPRVKRAVDILGSAAGLILFSPVMLAIAVAVKLDSPGPVFFRQARAGQGGRPFTIIKFRSMVDRAEQMLDQVIAKSCLPPPVFKIPNDPRVTRVGRFLRRFSLDELPQFVNVLRGEMSLVGPRPEELRIVALYREGDRSRLAAKPGMTGPMQTNGRGVLSLDDRLQLELAYAEKSSLWEDLRLLARTLPALFRGRGAF